MRWDATENDGFSTGTPWLPMKGAAPNVASLQQDARSILHLYRELIALRKRTPALTSGEYAPLRSRNDILAYERFTETERFGIALNLSHEPRRIEHFETGKIVISTLLDRSGPSISSGHLLRPDEGIVIQIA
jgi:alpha-glucosidase